MGGNAAAGAPHQPSFYVAGVRAGGCAAPSGLRRRRCLAVLQGGPHRWLEAAGAREIVRGEITLLRDRHKHTESACEPPPRFYLIISGVTKGLNRIGQVRGRDADRKPHQVPLQHSAVPPPCGEKQRAAVGAARWGKAHGGDPADSRTDRYTARSGRRVWVSRFRLEQTLFAWEQRGHQPLGLLRAGRQ